MYKMCDRCRFNVPAKQALCQVCGSNSFVSQQETASKPLMSAESIEHCKAGLEQASGKMQGVFSTFAKELAETAVKLQRAAGNMRKLMFEAGSEDRVMSFHRNVGSGRSVDFVPVFHAPQPEPQAIEPFRARLISDENVFAPKFDLTELRTAQTRLVESLKEVAVIDESASVEELKQQINDLTGWFQQFGKDGFLIKKELTAVPSNEASDNESRQAA